MIQQKQRSIIVVVILLILVLFSENGLSEKADDFSKKNAYIIIINRLTLSDIKKMSNIKKLADDGSVGLMNTRGADSYDGPQGYITINSSKRAFANYDSGLFFNIDSRLVNSYERRIGQDLNDAQIINADFNSLINLNKNADFSPAIGALGDNLHYNGYETAVFGNSDTVDSFIRTNCLIATDSRGRIDYGNLDNILITDKEFCYGYRTDYNKLYNEVIDIKDKAHLIVIETGDLNRLSSCKEKMSQEMFMINRNKVISEIDDYIGNLINSIKKEESLVLVLSPNREESLISDNKLSPIIIWGAEINKGVVTSGTTRRDGLVSNIDIAPTITNYFQASSTNFIGQPIVSKNRELAFEFLQELSTDISSISLIRNKILNIYNAIVIIAPLIVLLYLFFRKRFNTSSFKIIKTLLLSIIATPLGFLLMSLIKVRGVISYCLVIILFVCILNVLILELDYKYKFLLITSLIVTTIIIDVLTEGRLIKSSVLGYDPIIGARYFGIGNELLGVLLGTITLFCGTFLEIYRRHYYIMFILVIIIVVVVHPNLGANFGGSVAIIFMSLIFVVQVFNIRINLKTLISMSIICVLIFILVALYDSFISMNPSHLGKTVRIVLKGNPFYLIEVIVRKLSMNIKLIGTTTWSKTLYFLLSYILVNLLIFRDTIKDFFEKNRFLAAGFISTLSGSLIGFLVNDSGIIMASISIIYVTIFLLYVTIIEVEKIE